MAQLDSSKIFGDLGIANDLTVHGEVDITGQVRLGNSIYVGGAVPGGKIMDNGKAIVIGDDDTGIRQDGDGVLEFWTNNQERVALTQSVLNTIGSVQLQEQGSRVWTANTFNPAGKLDFESSNGTNVDGYTARNVFWSNSGGGVAGLTKPATTSNAVSVLHANTHAGDYYTQLMLSSTDNALYLRSKHNSTTWSSYAKVFSDIYHPMADKLTTGRLLTFTNDVTGSATFDGSSDINISLTIDKLDGVDASNYLRSDVSDTFTDLTGNTLRLTSAVDTSLTSTGHAFQIGPTTGTNLTMDSNEIQVRLNGAGERLNLNQDGGDVYINGGKAVTESAGKAYDSDRLDGFHASQFIRSDVNDAVDAYTTWSDGVAAQFGTGADMKLTHDGSNSKILNNNGGLQIRNLAANQYITIKTADSLGAEKDGILITGATPYVILHEAGSERLRTTATGTTTTGDAYVTGGVTADLDVAVGGDVNVTGTVNINGQEVFHPGNEPERLLSTGNGLANFYVTDFDFRFGYSDQVSRGDSGASRAMVKSNGALDINWSNDFGDVRINGLNAVSISAPQLRINGSVIADSTGVLYYGGVTTDDRYLRKDAFDYAAEVIQFQKGIRLGNVEATDNDSVGALIYDANFYGDAAYGTDAGAMQNVFGADGGGLAFKGEDGWAGVLDSRNMKWANVDFESVKVGGQSVIHSSSLTSGGQFIDGPLTIGRSAFLDITNTTVDSLVVQDGMYIHADNTSSTYLGFANNGTYSSRFEYDPTTKTLNFQAAGSAIMQVDGKNLIHSGGGQTINGALTLVGILNANSDVNVGGKLTLASSFSTEGQLNIPNYGTADPTAPINGDIWQRSNALYARLNGTTRTIVHNATYSTVSQAEAETGTATSVRWWTAQRVRQSVAAYASPLGHSHVIADISDFTDNSTQWDQAVAWGDHSQEGYLTSFTETDPTVPSHVKNIAALDISNWNAAYGWGDHSLEGYLTSFTETDPTVPAHVKSITTGDKTNWNAAYGWGDHSLEGYLTSFTETDPTVPAHVKSITTGDKTNWNAAYGWGDHALGGYLKLSGGTMTGQLITSVPIISSSDIYADKFMSNTITTGNKQVVNPTGTIIYFGNPGTIMNLESSVVPNLKIGTSSYQIIHTGGGQTIAGQTTINALRLSNGGDVTLSSTDHPFQIGGDAGANLAVDVNEIQARSNGAATSLYLNSEGGNVFVNGTKVSVETHNHDSTYLKLTGGTLTGNLNFAPGLSIRSNYGTGSNILKDHNNGHITVSAAGGDLYLGFESTTKVRLERDLYGNNGTTLIADASAANLYEGGTPLSQKYVNVSGDTMSGDLTVNADIDANNVSAVNDVSGDTVTAATKVTIGQVELVYNTSDNSLDIMAL